MASQLRGSRSQPLPTPSALGGTTASLRHLFVSHSRNTSSGKHSKPTYAKLCSHSLTHHLGFTIDYLSALGNSVFTVRNVLAVKSMNVKKCLKHDKQCRKSADVSAMFWDSLQSFLSLKPPASGFILSFFASSAFNINFKHNNLHL